MSTEDGRYVAFADFYSTGDYVRYSEEIGNEFEETLDLLDLEADRVLDVACGEGSFAVALAAQGFEVTGIDVSDRMIELARENAAEEGVDVDFRVMDARDVDLEGEFDVATCWFDSINHLTDLEEVATAFEQVYTALTADGTFVFDLNTIRKLASYETAYGETSSAIVRNTERQFEAYTDVEFDYETNVVSLTITGFEKEGDRWRRFDETHRERGYPLGDVRDALRRVGFSEVRCLDSLDTTDEPGEKAERVYFVAEKQ